MFTKVLILLLFLGISACYGANCTIEEIQYGKCPKTKAYEYYLMISFPYDDYILPGVAATLCLLPSLISCIVLIIKARKPLDREPTEKEIDAIQEDEADLEAKNKEYMKNMKNKLSDQNGKKMKEFAIKNEAVNQPDDQTVPIQQPDSAAPGQSAVTPSQISAASKI